MLVVFEPHQYIRCFNFRYDFDGIFYGTKLFQYPIIVSREDPPYLISDKEFFEFTFKNTFKSKLYSLESIRNELKKSISPEDIIIFAPKNGTKIVNSLQY